MGVVMTVRILVAAVPAGVYRAALANRKRRRMHLEIGGWSMRGLSIALAIGLLISSAPFDAAWSDVKTRVPSTKVPRDVRLGTVAPLTTNECAGLGGDVDANTSCKTGKACKVETADRGVRVLCITKAD